MKRTIRWVSVFCACMVLMFCGCSENGEKTKEPATQEITDQLGRTVAVPDEPQSVAILLGSFADVWMSAGGTVSAVVDEAWSSLDLDLPEDTVNLGDFLDVSMELLFESEPDLIIASANTQIDLDWMDTFEEMGIPALYFDVENFDDYLNMLEICTQITGRSDLYQVNGLDVKEQVDAVVASSAESVAHRGAAPTVLFLRASATSVKAKGSEGTVLGEMLADLGCVNIADGGGLLDNLSLEEIIMEDPDFIFIVFQGQDEEGTQKRLENELFSNPAWAELNAVREGRLYYMDRSLYHLKPNNRWGEAYENLAEILYD